MLYSSKILGEALDRANIRYEFQENMPKLGDVFAISNRGNHMMQQILLFMDNDNASVGTRVAKVPPHCIDSVLMEINDIHKEYRWIKAYIADDNWLEVKYDVMFTNDAIPLVCTNAILRVITIVDECYNRLMRHII